jgi:hypothetical protein
MMLRNEHLEASLHNCVRTSLENDYFREKLTEFYRENKKLKEQIQHLILENEKYKQTDRCEKSSQTLTTTTTDAKEQGPPSNKFNNQTNLEKKLLVSSNKQCSVCSQINRHSSQAKSRYTQTSELAATSNKSSSSSLVAVGVNTFDPNIYNNQNKKSYAKLCEMQQTLLQKYEQEVNMNAVKQSLINQMKLELDKCESACKTYENEMATLKSNMQDYARVKAANRSLKLDLESYKVKYEKYKRELDFFDDDFFIEIESLKDKYNEAVKMNKYYESILFKTNQINKINSKKKSSNNKVKFSADVDNDRGNLNNAARSCRETCKPCVNTIIDGSEAKKFSDFIIQELDVDALNDDLF